MSEIVLNDYKPIAPALRLHSSKAGIIVCVGGLGSGKSFSVVKEIEQSAIQWPGIPMAIYRKAMPSLRDSTKHEFEEHSDPRLGKMWGREDTYRYLNGSFVRFRGLDKATKAKSTNYALIVMEEAEEFTKDDFDKLNERVRAKGPWPLRIILVLNPVDEDHWIYQEFVKNAADYESQGLEVIHWSTYDNVENLPEGYIERASAGKTPAEIDRYLNGNWGTVVKGTPIYSDILSEIHIRKMERYPGQLLLRGWDFGFNHPAVSFRLVDELGRQNIAHAIMGERESLDVFAPRIIAETSVKFGNQIKVLDFGDPKGHDKSQSRDESCFDVLRSFGIDAQGIRGSREYVDAGIKQVRSEFNTLIKGIPSLTIDPDCSLIRAAYFGRYVWGPDGKPKKDGYYDHICDADRYISHHYRFGRSVQEAIARFKQKRVYERTHQKLRF